MNTFEEMIRWNQDNGLYDEDPILRLIGFKLHMLSIPESDEQFLELESTYNALLVAIQEDENHRLVPLLKHISNNLNAYYA